MLYKKIKRCGISLARYKRFWKASIIVSFVLTAIAFGFSVDKIKVGPFDEIYQTIVGIMPKSMTIIPKIRIFIIVWLIISIIMFFFRERYYLISIRALAPDLGKIDDKDIRENFWEKCIDIDISDIKKKKKKKKAIEEIDAKCRQIQRIRGNDRIGFYGIAHIPFLFKIGYNLGDQSNIQIFHKSRENDSVFKEWLRQKGSFKMLEPVELNRCVISDELIVTISTSFEIKNTELSSLDPDGKHILMLKGNILDFDSITCYKDAEKARNQIMESIRDFVKKYDIQKVHLVIASSAAFTFFLGMAYSRQHDPECIVYHYERPYYPWGISIKKTARRCIIKTPL